MAALHEVAHKSLPRLTADNYRVTSPGSWDYNCVAWALGLTDAWWWPVPYRYWPAEVAREESLAAFLAVFATHGYSPCPTDEHEPGWEKVVLYAAAGIPTHVARQLPDGRWTSKLGPAVDIEHTTVNDVAGGAYGEVAAVLSRRAATAPDSPAS
jgi:hypothetical protein